MNRYFLLCGLVFLGFVSGVVRVSSFEHETVTGQEAWSGTRIPDRAWQEEALTKLVASSRWEIVSQRQEGEDLGGAFSREYRLIGIVDNDEAYALLETSLESKEGPPTIKKVLAGDQLPNNWVVSEIQNAAVVAKRKDDSQRVELFPSD